MRKLLVITVLLFSAFSFAQDKFIEVEVEDTITIRPERFEYVVKVNIPDTSTVMVKDMPYEIKAEKAKYAKKEAELVKMLKKHKYNFNPIKAVDDDRGNMAFYTTTGVILTLKNEKEFADVQKLLDKMDHVYGSFGKVKYSNEQKAEEDLYKRLLEKAAAKATILATASKMKVGNVIAVKESKDIGGIDFNIGDTYFVAEDNKKLQMQDGKLVGSLYKMLVVRFAVE